MAPSSRPVVKLSSPIDVIVTVPHLVGFVPEESLVVMCLHGQRRRTGLTMRIDLPDPAHEDALAAEIAARVAKVGADAVLMVCYTEAADPPSPAPPRPPPLERVGSPAAHPAGRSGRRGGSSRTARPDKAAARGPRPPLVRGALLGRTSALLDEAGVRIAEALLVRDGRWWSYSCSGPCCPAEGTDLPNEPTETMTRVAAEAALTGRSVLADREALVASIRPRLPLQAVRAHTADLAAAAIERELHEGGWEAVRARTVSMCREARARSADGKPSVDAMEAARIVLGLRDVHARDEVGSWGIDPDAETLIPLLIELARHTPDMDAAPICTVLAWVAYQCGEGALTNVALERALRAEPDYTMAQLLARMMEHQVSPAQVRSVSENVRRDLREQRVVIDPSLADVPTITAKPKNTRRQAR